MSIIAAGTTTTTALSSTGNTDGTLQFQVNGTTPSVTLNTLGAIGVGSTPAFGTAGQALVSGGSTAAPSWANVTTSPAGSTGQVQYNNAGAFGAVSSGTNGQVLTSSGTGSAPTWTTIASGLSAATQAQMETATSNTVSATPLNTNWHPGVAKAWINATTTGTINSSWNIAGISDDGLGACTIFIDTDFSSANYVVTLGITIGSRRFVYTPNITAAYFTGQCDNASGSSSDPDAWLFACYGDQP